MNLTSAHSFALQLHGPFERQERIVAPSAPMYTPLWYASKVMATTANSWWEGGVPPASRRGQRAKDAVAHAAAGVARRLHVGRGTHA
ncbi:hypothetical protein [Xylophilus sp. GOD-11R]|uniref:hypothetical protein n=1 Tax=Xylophilus sp. GOD-11R TaxID=3089814 RepID=UPI00298CC7D7|nr:hypothetical protein [Xylophilus sp. GOD-11R]WPB56990.1 hypothetical protein R9X41_23135 [Xylophilus sp. GOD-11R]